MKIFFASNNTHKKQELEAILNIRLSIPSDSGIVFKPEETGLTFCDNALLKARELKKLLPDKDDIVIADDSGLCVDSLDGRPGVFSARYGEENGSKLTSMQKNLLLLKELGDNPKRSARFVCAMAVIFDFDRFIIVQETIEGEIVKGVEFARGTGGFGYDPIFLAPEFGKTMAELSEQEKNAISHRGKAGRIVRQYTDTHRIK